MRLKDIIVEPEDRPPGDAAAAQLFLDAEWPPNDARWLGPYCLSLLPRQDDEAPGLDFYTGHNLGVLARAWKEARPSRSRDGALLAVYARLCGCGGRDTLLHAPEEVSEVSSGGPVWRLPREQWQTVAHEFRTRGADFERAFVLGGWPGDVPDAKSLSASLPAWLRHDGEGTADEPEIVRLMRALSTAGLSLDARVDHGRVLAAGLPRLGRTLGGTLRVPPRSEWATPAEFDARSLTMWMIGLGPAAAAEYCAAAFRGASSELAPALLGVRHSIEQWLMVLTGRWTYFREAGVELGRACLPYVERVESICGNGTYGDAAIFRRIWLWFARAAFESDPSLLDADRRERLLRAANEDLSQLRRLLSRAIPRPEPGTEWHGRFLTEESPPLSPCEEFEWEDDHFSTCSILLFQHGGLWRGMKPLLLALRALSTPSVSDDLRYWPDPPLSAPPDPWHRIPATLINLFHYYAPREQAADPELVSLRGQFAGFLLERLTDRWKASERRDAVQSGRQRTDEDMVERSPVWRLCTIRAVVALGINPGGKGHRALHASSEIDPDPDVRDSARQAYEQLRRGHRLSDGSSPRRAVISALWWIRQAHLLGLGVQIDRDRAQRTREKELRRTKELEREPTPRY